jgi:hypothetical protein
MGTRSVIAIPHGDGWKGRYCHWDGYPSHQAETLQRLVARDGLQKTQKTLVFDYYGWSNLEHEQPDITFVEPERRRLGAVPTAANIAYDFGPDGSYGDGRFVNVPGYGVAYTTQDGQSSEGDWITHDSDNRGTEWAYVLSEGGLLVAKQSYRQQGRIIGLYPWDSKVDWDAVNDLAYVEDESHSVHPTE